ncbi:MAG: LysR substrate-binding domain-containing protein [Nannocystaceae bacterium]
MTMLPEIAQLEAFLALASELHFGRAAARLHVTQSTISHRLRALEDRLGLRLLERDARSVVLTPAGVAYLRRAERALHHLQEAAQAAQEAADGLEGALTLGYSGAISTTPVLPALARALEGARGLAVELQRCSLSEQLHSLGTGALDLGVTFLPLPAAPPGITAQVFARLPLVAWVAASHRLAGAEALTLAELSSERWIVLSDRAEEGFSLIFRATGAGRPLAVDALDAAAEWVRLGVGVTVMPAPPVAPPGLRLIPLEGAPPAEVRALWRTDRSQEPALARVLAALGVSAAPPRG